MNCVRRLSKGIISHFSFCSFVCALTTLTVLQWQVTVMQYIIQNNKNHWNHIPKTPLAWKSLKKKEKKGHFAHIGNEIKICSQNKCHHHLSKVCENSFHMFHSNWVISDYHSFVWQFEFPWLNLTNCPNKLLSSAHRVCRLDRMEKAIF